METLQSRKRVGHFQLFSVPFIRHTQLPGFQRVISRPFPAKRYRGSNLQDLVFVRPPDASKDFRVSINTVWYCRVLLLFSFHTSTDYGINRHDCAFMSVLWEYDPSGINARKAACRTSWQHKNDSILHAAARGGFCRRCIRYKKESHWRKQVVVYQHVGLELVARMRREMKKPSHLSCLFENDNLNISKYI